MTDSVGSEPMPHESTSEWRDRIARERQPQIMNPVPRSAEEANAALDAIYLGQFTGTAHALLLAWVMKDEDRAYSILHDPHDREVGAFSITLFYFGTNVLDEDHSDDVVELAREMIARHPNPEQIAMED